MDKRLKKLQLIALVIALLLLVAFLFQQRPDSGTRPPNILLIMADDLGYNDLHIYNDNPLAHTPNIDALALEGVRFTRHYTDTVCEPSRIALLTGQFPARLSGRSGSRGISQDVTTIADSLRAAGYRTHHVGKWHARAEIRSAWPDRQGFESYFGFVHQMLLDGKHVNGKHVYGKSSYEDPWLSTNGEPPREYPGHLTELLVENTVDSIRNFTGEQPWFINFWSLAPHFPTSPAPQWREKYPPTGEGQYLALISQLDDGVRRILQALQESGQADNTIVIFTSDNGGVNVHTDNNAPLHGRKLEYNEGGVRTPLIIKWPGHFPAGEIIQQPVGIIDLYPTLAKLAGAPVPANLDGKNIAPAIFGERLAPRAQYYERFQFGRPGYSVLSADGRWRLYVPESGRGFALITIPSEPLLYDLQKDPHGHNNVYHQHPEVVEQLTSDYRQWHRAARELQLNSTKLPGKGIQLKGMNLLRTPGYGGFTFAIAYDAPAAGMALSGPVAEQPHAWSLVIDEAGEVATLSFANNTVAGRVPHSLGCNSLIATAYFRISTLRPSVATNTLQFALHHNGELVSESLIRGVKEVIDNTSTPTTVGYSETSGDRFSGELGTPILLSSTVSTATPLTPMELHTELCPESANVN